MTFLELQNKFSKINNQKSFDELIYFLSNKVKTKSNLITSRNTKIDFSFQKFNKLVNLHFKKLMPLAYITNKINFYGIEFYVNQNVLIPRSDTEIVLKHFIKYVKKTDYKSKTFLDLCTGSGCLALSLSTVFNKNKIYGSDIDAKALKVANKNKAIVNAKNVYFIQANFLNCLKIIKQPIDYLICNPPYIDKNDPNLEASVKLYEPKKALYSAKKGLKFYMDFVTYVLNENWAPKICCFEYGFNQQKQIQRIFKPLSTIYKFYLIKDENQLSRAIILIRK